MVAHVAHPGCIVVTKHEGDKKLPCPFRTFREPNDIPCNEAEYGLSKGVRLSTFAEKTILCSGNDEARTPADDR